MIRPSRFGLVSNKAIEEILKKYIGNIDIKEARIPLAIVTTDIGSGEEIILKSGDTIKAALASSSLPGLFPPVEIEGRMLIDGGILENVPISPLEEFGAEYIIGVNLLRYRKYQKPKGVLGVLANSFDMVNHRISAQPTLGDAKILIEPDLSNFNMGDFDKSRAIIEIGYKEALKFMPELKKEQQEPPIQSFLKRILNLLPDKK
jgi:NTE family protein